ncbi:hypothetical protein JL720_17054 [Aureococcus anophagefferens]|nr:hypothetical protein JL720_17054 [Aureococcus anophagefferens]
MDLLSGSSLEKSNEDFLNNLQQAQPAAPKPAMMAPPQAQPYQMPMAPNPYGAPMAPMPMAPNPYGMPMAPNPYGAAPPAAMAPNPGASPSPLGVGVSAPVDEAPAASLGDALDGIGDFVSGGGDAEEDDADGGGEVALQAQIAEAGSGDLERYTVAFESEVKLGMLLERRHSFTPGDSQENRPELTVVTMVIDGGAAERKGVVVGSKLLVINGVDATKLPYAKCLDMVKTLPRPLTLVLERSRASVDTAKGCSATKAQYEDIVVRMFQGQPLTGFKYKAYALTHAFKCSNIQSKQYAGEHTPLKFFCLRNPRSRTKTATRVRQPSSSPRSTRMRFATKGWARGSPRAGAPRS